MLPEGRGCAHLLGQPRIGGMARHPDVQNLTRGQSHDEEGIERPEEQVGDRQEVASPDVCAMVVQKCRPRLARGLGRAHGTHVLLDGPLRHPDVQLEQCQGQRENGSVTGLILMAKSGNPVFVRPVG